jgi:hypothetical protein
MGSNFNGTMPMSHIIANGLNIVGKVKNELNQIDEGIVPRRKRFIE